MHACMHACMHTSIHPYIHTSIHPYIHPSIHPYIPTYIPTYLHTYIPTYQHTYIPTYLHTYIPTYLHTNIPTYQHTNIPPPRATAGVDQKNHTTTTGHRGGGGPEEPYHHHRPPGGGDQKNQTILSTHTHWWGGEGGWPTLHHIYIYIYEEYYKPLVDHQGITMFLWLKQLKAPRNYVVKSPLTHYPIMSQRGLTPDVLDLQLQTFSIWPGDTNLFSGQPWSNWKSYGHCHGYQRITRGYRKPECFYQLRFKTEMSYSFPFSHFWKQSNHLRKLECNRMYHTFSV